MGGGDVTQLASMGKLKSGRLVREVADKCLQFWGGMGYTNEVSARTREGRFKAVRCPRCRRVEQGLSQSRQTLHCSGDLEDRGCYRCDVFRDSLLCQGFILLFLLQHCFRTLLNIVSIYRTIALRQTIWGQII